MVIPRNMTPPRRALWSLAARPWRAAVPQPHHHHHDVRHRQRQPRLLGTVAAAPFATSTSSIGGAATLFWSGETNKLAELLDTARAAHQSMLDELEVRRTR